LAAVLLAAGANPNVENARDATPAEVAAAHNFTEFAELVRVAVLSAPRIQLPP
jgi:ankyrin repeat protein